MQPPDGLSNYPASLWTAVKGKEEKRGEVDGELFSDVVGREEEVVKREEICG